MPRDEFDFPDDDESDIPYWEEQRFHDIWEDEANQSAIDEARNRTHYSEREIEQAHVELFFPFIQGEDRNVQENLWKDYIDVMVNGRGSREEFFSELGIYARDFDWEGWRTAMGYRARNK